VDQILFNKNGFTKTLLNLRYPRLIRFCFKSNYPHRT